MSKEPRAKVMIDAGMEIERLNKELERLQQELKTLREDRNNIADCASFRNNKKLVEGLSYYALEKNHKSTWHNPSIIDYDAGTYARKVLTEVGVLIDGEIRFLGEVTKV